MSFDWNRYCVLADDLREVSGAGGTEARLRSSISRGYYGVFHLVRQMLARRGNDFGTGLDVHQEIVRYLRTSGDALFREMGMALGRARTCRNAADYRGLSG